MISPFGPRREGSCGKRGSEGWKWSGFGSLAGRVGVYGMGARWKGTGMSVSMTNAMGECKGFVLRYTAMRHKQ